MNHADARHSHIRRGGSFATRSAGLRFLRLRIGTLTIGRNIGTLIAALRIGGLLLANFHGSVGLLARARSWVRGLRQSA